MDFSHCSNSKEMNAALHRHLFGTDKHADGTSASVPEQPDAEDQSHPEAIFVAQDDTRSEP